MSLDSPSAIAAAMPHELWLATGWLQCVSSSKSSLLLRRGATSSLTDFS